MHYDQEKLARLIDYAVLKPNVTPRDVKEACGESLKFGFHALCVNTCYVKLAAEMLRGSGVKVCAAVSFPFGASPVDVKAFEAAKAVEDGAEELDVVANIGMIKSHNWESFRGEVEQIVDAANGATVKVIIEVGYLDQGEIERCCEILGQSGVDFVKTCTGFGPRGVLKADVELLKKAGRGRLKVKAAGGVKTLNQVMELLEAGADRIGTSSAPAIVNEIGGS